MFERALPETSLRKFFHRKRIERKFLRVFLFTFTAIIHVEKESTKNINNEFSIKNFYFTKNCKNNKTSQLFQDFPSSHSLRKNISREIEKDCKCFLHKIVLFWSMKTWKENYLCNFRKAEKARSQRSINFYFLDNKQWSLLKEGMEPRNV